MRQLLGRAASYSPRLKTPATIGSSRLSLVTLRCLDALQRNSFAGSRHMLEDAVHDRIVHTRGNFREVS